MNGLLPMIKEISMKAVLHPLEYNNVQIKLKLKYEYSPESE